MIRDRVEIFPLSERAVLAGFAALSPLENPDSEAEISSETIRLSISNTDLYQFYAKLLAVIADQDLCWWGALLAHRIMTEEAKGRGLKVLPRLNSHFVESFKDRDVAVLMGRISDSPIDPITAAQQVHRARYLGFSSGEPDFSRILRQKDNPNIALEDHESSPITSGVIFIHALFKEGLSDPKNYI